MAVGSVAVAANDNEKIISSFQTSSLIAFIGKVTSNNCGELYRFLFLPMNNYIDTSLNNMFQGIIRYSKHCIEPSENDKSDIAYKAPYFVNFRFDIENQRIDIPNLDNYPVINNGSVSHNRIVLLSTNYQTKSLMVTDGSGNVRNVAYKTYIESPKDKIANPELFDESMYIKNSDFLNIVGNGQLEYAKYIASFNKTKDKQSIVDRLSDDFVNKTITENSIDKVRLKGIIDKLVNMNSLAQNKLGQVKDRNDNDADEDKSPHTEIIKDTGKYSLNIVNKGDKVIVCGITPIDYDGHVTIPNGVTTIADMAFENARFRGITLPETLIYLGDGCFSMSSILEVKLPKGVKAIPNNCFYKAKLRKINLDDIDSIGNYAFFNTNLLEVNIGPGVVQIGISAFEKCRQLEYVNHKRTIKKIRTSAFNSCTKLSKFDTTGVEAIEAEAFLNTAIEDFVIPGDVVYAKANTISGKYLKSVEFKDGITKVAAGSAVNSLNKPIIYTMAKSVVNIDSALLKPKDTVRCYRYSVAESSAQLAGCNIEYLDTDSEVINKKVQKIKAMGQDIHSIMTDAIALAYSKDDVQMEYAISGNTINIELTEDIMNMLGLKPIETPDNFKESVKFKMILNHLSRVAPMTGKPLCGTVLSLADTFSASILEKNTIYDDEVSRIYTIRFRDNRYFSQSSTFILALTGNTARYICLSNRYTDIQCESTLLKDMSKVISILSVGDTIGHDCIIRGTKIEKSIGDSSKNIKTKTKSWWGNVANQKMKVNILQALMYCGVVIKLSGNTFIIAMPYNNNMILCSSQGRSVWNNENEKGFETYRAVINDIQDIDNNTLFDYDAKLVDKDGQYIKYLSGLNESEVKDRLLEYSVVHKAIESAYLDVRNEFCGRAIVDSSNLETDTVERLMKLPIIESRTAQWLYKYIGKTIVPYEKDIIKLADGGFIRQYQTVKRLAMRNKLLTGGDRKIFIFEVFDKSKNRIGIYASQSNFDELVEQVISSTRFKLANTKVFDDPERFDIVYSDELLLISPLFCDILHIHSSSNIWLVMYKPNGRYYIAYREHAILTDDNTRIASRRSSQTKSSYSTSGVYPYVLLMQVGDFNVTLDYIDTVSNSSNDEYKVLYDAGTYVLTKFKGKSINERYYFNSYHKLKMARKLAIDGETDIQKYFSTGLPKVLCYMIGYGRPNQELYNLPSSDNYKFISMSTEEPFDNSFEDKVKSASSKVIDTSNIPKFHIDFDTSEVEDYYAGVIEDEADDSGVLEQIIDHDSGDIELYSDEDLEDFYGSDEDYQEEGEDEEDGESSEEDDTELDFSFDPDAAAAELRKLLGL